MSKGFVEGVPTVTIELGGSRTLGFTLGAMRRIKELGGTLEMPEDDESAQLLAIPTYIWACMSAEDRAVLSVEQIEDMIHPGNMQEISEIISKLFVDSQPKGAEGNALPVPPKVRRKASR